MYKAEQATVLARLIKNYIIYDWKKGWNQNFPSSQDLIFPTKTVWEELKEIDLNRNPKIYEEEKKYCIEEWNKIEPRKYFKNF